MDNLKAGCRGRHQQNILYGCSFSDLPVPGPEKCHDFAGRVRHLSQGLGPDSRDARIRRALLINSILVYFFLRPPRNQRFYSV